ncbi:MAG: hypothetical protein ACHQCE_07290 [Streptosporangiales bacterium]
MVPLVPGRRQSTASASACSAPGTSWTAEYVRVIERLAARGCDAVALVCTEIPLLVTPEASLLPTLDSTRLLARTAFDVAAGQQAMRSWRGGAAGG